MRLFPYVPSVRKSPTDRFAGRTEWEKKEARAHLLVSIRGIRNIVSPVGSTNQKTGHERHYRSSSSDLGAEDMDRGILKKLTPSTDGRNPYRTPSMSLNRNLGLTTPNVGKSTPFGHMTVSRVTPSPRFLKRDKHKFDNEKRSSFCKKTPRRSSMSPSPARSTSMESRYVYITASFSSNNEKEGYNKVRSRKRLLKFKKFNKTQTYEAFMAQCSAIERPITGRTERIN